jgi:hypothetical protein
MSVRGRVGVFADVASLMAMVAWVGGHAALGAFAARIAFRSLPRPLAAQTMTQVFHEFDLVIAAAIGVLLISAVLGVWARGGSTASQVRLGLELGLCALGVFELADVHPRIESLYDAGRTLEPAFAAVHRLSERCAHGEVLLVLLAAVARAWPVREASP